ncbi:MAG: acyloxyacyl hydrolase [Candidatus Methylomirabilales bacterium]
MRRPGRHVLLMTILMIGLLPGAWAAGDGLGTATKREKAASASPTDLFGLGKMEIGLSAGYGDAIPVGGTDDDELEEVEFVYVAPRFGIGISDPMGGDAWYRGNLELLGEGAFLANLEPKDGFAGGITAMLRYNFLPRGGGNFIPFVELGAGIIFLDIDLKNQADGFNFTPQGGFGFHYFVSERTAFTAEWRFHHISNAGTRDENDGINDSLVLGGVSVFFK